MISIEKVISRSLLSLALVTLVLFCGAPLHTSASSASVNVWWPTNGAHVQGTQPFKAMVAGLDVSQYDMFWQVDGGQWNRMDNNYTDYQHKEADVDLSGWTWRGNGPYVVNFVARQGSTILAQQSETVYVDKQQVTPTAAPAILTKSNLYIQSDSEASQQAGIWTTNNLTSAAAMQMLAAQPTAMWFGNWNSNVESDVHALVASSTQQGAIPVMVAYNIPERDCGGFSAGGSDSPAGYASWIQSFTQGLGTGKAMVILEPDALADISCLSAADQATRLQLLSHAVSAIKSDPNAKVYIDAGHSNWIDPTTMAAELQKANVAQADGFSLNVSNFMLTSDEVTYGQQISSQIGNKHFVIDTSRNGNGSNGQWCNPSGMAIGTKPTTQTGNPLVDAYLWVKAPGESDGTCNGGPAAGVWWPNYALQLVQNAHN